MLLDANMQLAIEGHICDKRGHLGRNHHQADVELALSDVAGSTGLTTIQVVPTPAIREFYARHCKPRHSHAAAEVTTCIDLAYRRGARRLAAIAAGESAPMGADA